MYKNIAIIGTGGFAKEMYHHLKYYFLPFDHDTIGEIIFAMDMPPDKTVDDYTFVIAIGSGDVRRQTVLKNKHKVEWLTLYPEIFNDTIKFGEGLICMRGVIMTCDITIGDHCQFNLNTTIGHDVRIGNYVTTAPGVHISGNVTIGNNVYIGSGATIRQGVTICDNVVIGMGAAVVRDITEPGTYVGVPAAKIK